MQSAFALELKSISDSGEFEGLASVYGNVDSVGDVVMPGAFTKTLAASKDRPLLFEHRDTIGTVQLSDSPGGLKAKGKFTLAVQKAKEAYALLKDGAVKGLSIGYQAVQSDYASDGTRQLKELKLWEISLCTFAANELATVTAVKSADLARIREALQEFKSGVLQALTKASAKTKKVDGVDLPASAFAFVGDPEDNTSTWKLPIDFPNEEQTKRHIRNALSRFNQTEGIPASEKPKVLAKIRAAARKYNIGNY